MVSLRNLFFPGAESVKDPHHRDPWHGLSSNAIKSDDEVLDAWANARVGDPILDEYPIEWAISALARKARD